MTAYAALQQFEFTQQKDGYTAILHQSEVGTGYFDEVSNIISNNSTTALSGSTEVEQFKQAKL